MKTNDQFTIQSSIQDAVTKVRVLTIEGKQVKSFHFSTKEELINHNFDLGDLTSGLYFISMKNKYGIGTKKLILE
ncbi:T9SS type A sorting domain-containing protein [Flavobacteriaceae bacterium]|nr:T9SS type A sorting domain-containing protein [Flavobacteriaceae bacterium]